ncbi:MAG TPA: FkbM family methyltransferase [Anaerolineaceae bacterium]|nr:FkbM family methyltransferase [Anaerolineaceae bacterium]
MKLRLKLAALAARILPPRWKTALYRSRKLSGLIRNNLNSAAPQGMSTISIAGGMNKDMQLKLDMQTEKDYWLGTYEVDLQDAIKKYCERGMVVYDVGANIGYISLMFAKQSGETGRVFAFEPLPANCARLQENIELNDLTGRIHLTQAAVVDKPGKISFMVHQSGAMGKAQGSLGRDEHYMRAIEVKAITLDDFIFQQGHVCPDLVKMDIEGGEVLAIKGMQRTLRECNPIMLVEIHSHSALECLWEAFQKADYHLYKMEKAYPLIQDLMQLGEKTYAVAIPNKKAG